MTAKELWNEYCEKNNLDKNKSYAAWSFGDDADELAKLVCNGIKTATCSLEALYELDEEDQKPKVGDISVILNSHDEAICIIKDTRVYSMPFYNITAEHAYKEGEGDKSLAYWRQVHKDFFLHEAAEYGISFNENSNVLCEEFEVLYRA